METRLSDSDLKMEDLAKALHVSPDHFAKLFRRHLGHSPRDHLKELRLRQALRLLKESQHPIKKISMDCGYENLNHFHRLFKKRYGVTPGEIRSH